MRGPVAVDAVRSISRAGSDRQKAGVGRLRRVRSSGAVTDDTRPGRDVTCSRRSTNRHGRIIGKLLFARPHRAQQEVLASRSRSRRRGPQGDRGHSFRHGKLRPRTRQHFANWAGQASLGACASDATIRLWLPPGRALSSVILTREPKSGAVHRLGTRAPARARNSSLIEKSPTLIPSLKWGTKSAGRTFLASIKRFCPPRPSQDHRQTAQKNRSNSESGH